MGADASKPALYHNISKALPPADPYGIHANSDWVDKGSKAFASAADREQFIRARSPNVPQFHRQHYHD